MLSTSAFFLFGHSKSMTEENHPITKMYEVPSFEGVSLAASYDVSVEYGAKQEVSITAPEHLMDKVVVKVKNNVLILDLKKGKYHNPQIKAKVILPKLTHASVAGSGEMRVATFSGQQLRLVVTGSGDLNTAELYVKEQLEIILSGSGSIRTQGNASHSNIKLTGAGNCEASQLTTQTNNTIITGSGSVSIDAQHRIQANLMGSGSLYYQGEPEIEQSSLGSGKVRRQ